MFKSRKKRRVVARRKRTLDQNIIIDYKRPDTLKRFITDRGKIIPRRISGATASQQRVICREIKRARYLSLLPCAVNHRTEKGFSGEMAAVNAVNVSSYRGGPGGGRGPYQGREGGGGRDFRDGPREGGFRSEGGGGGRDFRDGPREGGFRSEGGRGPREGGGGGYRGGGDQGSGSSEG